MSVWGGAFALPAYAQVIDGQTRILRPTVAAAPMSSQPAAQSEAELQARDPAAAPAKNAKRSQTTKNTKMAEAQAQAPRVSAQKPPIPGSTINLINLLVKKGIIDDDQARDLIKQAEDEAYIGREANKQARAKAEEAAKAASDAAQAALPPGTRHVTYVPEVVKRQLRQDIRNEVMEQAKNEGWASPGKYPEWAQRIHFYGDVRFRFERDLFPKGNDQADAFNFNAINIGSPFDIGSSQTNGLPTYNATQNRTRPQFRARLGMEAELDYGVAAGLRIATGDNSTPVSTNQTFDFNGGNFSKYAVWLDRAYLSAQKWDNAISVSVGRIDNPFWSPTDLVWYRELGFDGIATQAKYEVIQGVTPFGVAGAFPIFNTGLNASFPIDVNGDPSGAPTQVPSHDKYLFGGQLGVNVRFTPEYNLRLAGAYYDFYHVQGEVSDPCSVITASDVCGTDLTRPSFAQKGNTYIALRNILPNPSGTFTNQFQFFGLASQFQPVVASAQLDFANFHPIHILLDGEYVRNLAFDRNAIINGGPPGRAGGPANNFAPTSNGSLGPFDGGNQGFMARLTVGVPAIRHLWDWNAYVGYKYLQSDATVDALVDSEFSLGGTNIKGYIVGANLGITENVSTGVRWMSANNVGGAPFASDIFLLDLNAKF
jgi:hypothetical protein